MNSPPRCISATKAKSASSAALLGVTLQRECGLVAAAGDALPVLDVGVALQYLRNALRYSCSRS